MGEVFAGRYELVDPIGRGGVGAVWRAWDQRRRRYVAAKVLQQSDAHSLLRFVREQALRIDHPHVLAPASWAADDDKVLFTMDLVAGGSLVHLVGDYGPLPQHFVCTLLDQLLSGLAAVHAEGVVHRDIKPANLLLEATGTGRPRLRVSDFGIAMRLGEPRLTETNLVVGTPGYLAPEQMMGAEPDFPADLFAVGLVTLYLLEGAKPDAKAIIQYFAEHGTPGAPKGIPEPLWDVVATLLQPDPQARFRTATGARKALASARELLPEPGPDDETIEIFDQLGPLPPGFGEGGPVRAGVGGEGGAGGGRRPEADHGAVAGDGAADVGGGGVAGGWSQAERGVAVGSAGAGTGAEGGIRGGSADAASRRAAVSGGAGADGAGAAYALGAVGLDAPEGGGAAGSVRPGLPLPQGAPLPPGPPAVPGPPVPPMSSGSALPTSPPGGSASLPPGAPSAQGAPSVQGRPTPSGPSPLGAPTPSEASAPSTSSASTDLGPQASRTAPPPAQPSPTPPPSPMSDTGSFHLPPPQPTATTVPISKSPRPDAPWHPSGADQAPVTPPPWPQTPPPAPVSPPPWPVREPQAEVPTAPYTAQVPVTPPPQPEPSSARSRGRSRRARRKPGPPAAVVIPVLLLALACYAVGFWALAHV
ncbi:serine/threonine-protein kinase [Streptomyces sp. YIM S03343]